MRSILLTTMVLAGIPLSAQAPPSDSQTLSALLAEVQKLRLAIERNTLLGARTQITILQLQNQQGRTDKVSKDLEDARKEVSQIENERKTALLVGHNPGIEELLMLLTGESKRVPTGAFMQIDLKSSKWTNAADKRAKLAWLIKPRKLD